MARINRKEKKIEIHVIGDYKDIAIYKIYEKGEKRYEHGLNPFDSFNSLGEVIYDIDEILTYKKLCKRGDE